MWKVRAELRAEFPDTYTEIMLSPLSEPDTQELISGLVPLQGEFQLRQDILQKTGGNPFFVEEILKAVIDPSVGKGNRGNSFGERLANLGVVPDSIQALLLSRIDRLEMEVRQTLQLASVIGRSFYESVLGHISEKTIDLKQQLQTLQQSEMILESERIPELLYIFRHELTRDAAYQSLLQSQRRKMHRKVGQALETLFPDRLEEDASRLAYHFDRAGDYARALKYFAMAGDRSRDLFAIEEAVQQYSRAIELARTTEPSNDLLIELFTKLGRTYELGNQYDEALATYQELETLAHEREEPALELASLVPRAVIHAHFSLKFDSEKALHIANRALVLARDLNDHQAEARALWGLMLTEIFQSESSTEKALRYGRQSEAIARKFVLQRELAFTLHDMWWVFDRQGNYREGLAAMVEARDLWRELDDKAMLADNLVTTSRFHISLGNLEQAFPLLEEARKIGFTIRSPWAQSFSLAAIGSLYLLRGDIKKGIQTCKESLPLAEQAHFSWPLIEIRIYLAQAYFMMGDLDQGLAFALQARETASTRGRDLKATARMEALKFLYQGDLNQAKHLIWQSYDLTIADWNMETIQFINSYLGMNHIPIAEIALADEAFEALVDLTDRAVTHMRMRTRTGLPNWLYIQAQVFQKLGREEEAYNALQEARDEAQRMLIRPILWKILMFLSKLEQYRDNEEAGNRLRQEAVQVIHFMADQAGSQALRGSFLALPDVRAVLRDEQ